MLPQEETIALARFTRRTFIVLLVVGLALVLWQLSSLLILVFGGVLLAVIVRRLADLLAGATGLPNGWSLAAVFLALLAVIAGVGWLVGAQLAGQFQQLAETATQGVDRLRQWLEGYGLGGLMTGGGEGQAAAGWLGRGLVSSISGAASMLADVLAGVLVILFVGIYLAVSPRLYRRGLVLLFPADRHRRVEEVLSAMGEALWRWMMGQFVSMVTIGVLVTIALWLLGVPMAGALGLVAGLLEFVPIIGPWLAAVPAVLVGLTQGLTTALWVLVAYLAVQQVESYVVTPLAEKWAVALPPALTVVAAMAFGLLFGFIGLLFATPIAVAIIVAVRMLYVRDTLGQKPGEKSSMPG